MSSNGNQIFLVANGMCGQLVTEKNLTPMGCVDSQQPKKIGCYSSSLKAIQNFQSPTTNFTADDQKFLIANWPTIQLVTKGNQN
jgi:hypothetical protein